MVHSQGKREQEREREREREGEREYFKRLNFILYMYKYSMHALCWLEIKGN